MLNFPQEKSFLGRGSAFPPAFGLDNSVEMVANVEDIRQSLTILFNTQLGEQGLDPMGALYTNSSSNQLPGPSGLPARPH